MNLRTLKKYQIFKQAVQRIGQRKIENTAPAEIITIIDKFKMDFLNELQEEKIRLNQKL